PCLPSGERTESRDHLFYACPYWFTVWNYLCAMIGHSISPDWNYSLHSLVHSLKSAHDYAIIYHIWRAQIIDNVIRHRIISRHKDLPEMRSPSFNAGLMSTVMVA
ncbi:predicted protein, partial [Arabidopsis lyrata subsp. lyrata]